jgi:phosphoserine phosphatase
VNINVIHSWRAEDRLDVQQRALELTTRQRRVLDRLDAGASRRTREAAESDRRTKALAEFVREFPAAADEQTSFSFMSSPSKGL